MFFGTTPTNPLKLTEKHRRILLDNGIDETGPGTIVRDFETLLAIIGRDGIAITGKHRLISIKHLGQINQSLVDPIEINLARPQQKSFPNIHGLYLLLYSTGITKTRKEKRKPILFVDQKMLQMWKTLNPTEKYFTLLEAWFLRGVDEILGERSGWAGEIPPIIKCVRFVLSIKTAKPDEENLIKAVRYSLGFHHLALLWLFGIVSIAQDKSKEGKGWRVQKVFPTPFGDALMRVIAPITENPGVFFEEIAPPTNGGARKLRTTLQPFFPEWKNTFAPPRKEQPFRDGTHLFKITLEKAWAKIAIDSTLTFDELAYAILKAFDFDSDHLYQFLYRNEFGLERKIIHSFMKEDNFMAENSPATSETTIGELGLAPGDALIFHFDFGDDWRFEVDLEKIEPVNSRRKRPKLVERYGTPPEQYPSWDEAFE